MRQRRVHAYLRCTARAEKYAWEQAACLNAAKHIGAADIESAPWDLEGVTGQISVGAKDPTGPLPEIGNDHNLGLIISCAGFDPCLPLAHVVRRSQVGVSVAAADLPPT